MPRVAIVHDYLTQRGGAERVVLSLARLFPDAPVYTSIYDAERTHIEFLEVDVRTTWLQRLPRRTAGRGLLPLYPAAFRSLRLEGYDLVISSSSGFAHGVDAGDALHVTYCYTPPRWLYLTDRYLAEGSPAPRWAKGILHPMLVALRHWDRRAARRPDAYVGISSAVADRIAEAYGREADVVHPPVGVRGTPAATGGDAADPYFLVVSRLLPYKRADLAVRACRELGARLVVVGEGPALDSLRALSSSSDDVEIRGSVDDVELVRLLQGCTALIQAGEEDFGLMPLEANAVGRPAVAFARGGATETVIDGVTGVLFDEPTVASLLDALRRVTTTTFDPDKLRHHVETFGEARFHRELIDAVVSAANRTSREDLAQTVTKHYAASPLGGAKSGRKHDVTS